MTMTVTTEVHMNVVPSKTILCLDLEGYLSPTPSQGKFEILAVSY